MNKHNTRHPDTREHRRAERPTIGLFTYSIMDTISQAV